MKSEPARRIPKGARYPIFFLGLLIIIVGGLAGEILGASQQVEIGIGALGFILLIISVGLR